MARVCSIACQPAGEHFGSLRGGGVGFLAAALDGELGGVKLFLDLQVGAQHVLGVRFVRLPRWRSRRGGLRPETARGETTSARTSKARRGEAAIRKRMKLILLISIDCLQRVLARTPPDGGAHWTRNAMDCL